MIGTFERWSMQAIVSSEVMHINGTSTSEEDFMLSHLGARSPWPDQRLRGASTDCAVIR
jgi:hypothetical protein